jgi:hypothetical protein
MAAANTATARVRILNLASGVPQCLFCKGTGVCQTCDGKGSFSPFDDTGENDIQKLFG